MATQLQLRRGTEAQNDAFTGAEGELTYDTTNNRVRIHNGSTQGGIAVGTAPDYDNKVQETLTASGDEFTASADGWYFMHFQNGNLTDHWVNISINGDFMLNFWAQVANNTFGIPPIPVKKGDVLEIRYGNGIIGISNDRFYFVPAV